MHGHFAIEFLDALEACLGDFTRHEITCQKTGTNVGHVHIRVIRQSLIASAQNSRDKEATVLLLRSIGERLLLRETRYFHVFAHHV